MYEIRPGVSFGRFKLLERLGAGATAQVFKAYDEERGADVALKIVPADLEERVLKRFVAETRILARLNHPNVVKIYEVGVEAGRHFYVMEYVEGETLQRLIETRYGRDAGIVSATELMATFADLASALRYTHAQNVFHRDIKPGNILIDRSFKAILMDFGTAKAPTQTALTESGSMVGTPLYMSPEQLQGQTADHLSDIYALGLVMYQMATGRLPFDSETPYAAATRRLSEDVPPASTINPTLDPLLDKLLLKCLRRDKRERHASANALLQALHDVPGFPESRRQRGGGPPPRDVATLDTAPAGSLARAAASFVRRHAVPLAAAAGAALALVLAWLVLLPWLTAPARVEYVYGRLQLQPSSTSAEVSLATTPALRVEVVYRSTGGAAQVVVISEEPRSEHRGSVAGLAPDTRYLYRFRFIDESGRLLTTDERAFKTRPPE